MTMIRCGVGRKRAPRLHDVSPTRSVVVRSMTYSVWGVLAIIMSIAYALTLVGMLRCRDSGCRSPGEATAVMGMFSISVGIFGWYYLLCGWMRVTARGIELVNPLNVATIAWADLLEAYATPNSLSLRLSTRDFTVGVFPIEVSNWETWLPSRKNRAQIWAAELNALRDRSLADGWAEPSGTTSSEQRWRIRILPLVLAVAPWAVVVLLFHPQLAGL
jgi:hypothetical protein